MGGVSTVQNLKPTWMHSLKPSRTAKKVYQTTTQAQQSRNLLKWKKFLESCGIRDVWLDSFPSQVRPLLVGAFVAALRRNQFGKKVQPRLLHSTITGAISALRTEFRKNMRSDPATDGTREMSILIKRQLRGYKDADPATKQAKALPLLVFSYE